MRCEGCGTTKAYRTMSVDITEKGQWVGMTEVCNECAGVTAPWIPDVYLNPGPEFTLPDGKSGPMTFTSKREKAAFLRSRGLREAGDKDNRSNPGPTETQKHDALVRECKTALEKASSVSTRDRISMVMKQFNEARGRR